MRLSKLNILLIFILALIIGLLFGTLINDIPYFTLRRDISPMEIFNLIAALTIATYIRFFLDRRINNNRIEKDILIQSCNKLKDEIYDLKKTIIDPTHVSQEILKPIVSRTIIIRITSIGYMLFLLLKNINKYAEEKEIKSLIMRLKDDQDAFWTDLTSDITGKRKRITQEIYVKTEKNINSYSGDLSELIMRINGC